MNKCSNYRWLPILPVLAIAGSLLQQGDGASQPSLPGPNLKSIGNTWGVVGSASCSGRSCHGGLSSAPDQGRDFQFNEFSLWSRRDPHAKAFDVLLTPEADRIARGSGHGKASTAVACLACHVTPWLAASVGHESWREELQFGVGCESCHGHASGWLAPHQTRGWSRQADREKQFGMVSLMDTERRAQMCVGCHVGAPAHDGIPARDMNHDMIASGHPILRFEYSAFMANLPPHWKPSRQSPPTASDWAIGQLVTAEATLQMLGRRAQSKEVAWPEFSDLDCYACHRSLAMRSGSTGPRMAGALPLNNWAYAMPSLLLDSKSGGELEQLRRQGLGVVGNRPNLEVSIESLTKVLQSRRDQLRSFSSGNIKALLEQSLSKDQQARFLHWESQEQQFFAAAVVDSAAAIRDLEKLRPLPLSTATVFHDSLRQWLMKR